MAEIFEGGRTSRRDGPSDECRGDLLARERRGELSEADALALHAHLESCSSCRVARQIFVDLDDASGVGLRDGVRIERMSNAARRWAHRRNPGARMASRLWKGRARLRVLGLTVAVLLVGGAASAAVWLWRHPETLEVLGLVSPETEPTRRLAARGVRGRGPVASANRSSPGASLEEIFPPSGSSEMKGAALSPAADSDVAAVHSRLGPSPGQPARSSRRRHGPTTALTEVAPLPGPLLRRAGEARRAGEGELAEHLYRSLQREFPGSSEAALSSVAIGGLLLERKAPRSALVHFDAYLKSPRRGSLIPEALYGRARALADMGESRKERATWERLVDEFPDSAYGPTARRRLTELK